MKTLRESLFDKDLIKRKPATFGDLYKPVKILYRGTEDLEVIGNMFVMSKLKNNTTPLELDGIAGYDRFKKLLDYLPYVLSKVAELPIDERFESIKTDGNYVGYEFKLDDMFKNTLRSNSTKLGIYMSKSDWQPELHILKSNWQGSWGMIIKYDKI